MRISLNWLNDFIDIKDKDPKELGDKITNGGVVVENIEKICTATNLVVGEVIKCDKHPNSDHLNLCKVNIGDEINTIICGATNVKENIKVIVAKEGAQLPETTIKKAKIRGIESNGMICALNELGLDMEEKDFNGIHILNNDAKVGTDPLEYLGLDDTIYHLDLEANRNDCLSIKGFAYATGAVINEKVNIPKFNLKEEKELAETEINIKTDTENCETFLGRIVKDIEIKESPNFIKSRLIAAGMRPINNVVDISNYIMLEYGQPLHFYDKKKVGNKIVVKMAKEKEKFKTLDKKERTLTKEDIVISDGEKTIGLAGVMGGLNTEITNNTTEILIESAIFNPYNIRYTSINNQLRSEASIRFEKGLDPKATKEAIDKAAYLLSKYAKGKVLKGIVGFDNSKQKDKEIEISIKKINDVLGIKLTKEDINLVWKKLEFDYKEKDGIYKVIAPTRRLDISIKEDLIEEIGSVYGYNNIIPKLPISTNKKGGYTKFGKYKKEVSNYLKTLAGIETKTYTLINELQSKMFDVEKNEKIELLLPMSEDKKIIRHSIIPSMLNVIEYNLARKQENMLLYEISNVYYNKNKEEVKLAISGLGSYITNEWQNINVKIDFYLLKGIVEKLLNYLGLQNRYSFKELKKINELHPNKSAEIIVDKKTIGFIGEVHPSISEEKIIVSELSLSKLYEFKTREIKYKEVSNQPSSKRDLAIIVDKKIKAREVMETINKSGGKILKEAKIFDLYQDSSLGENNKSLAIQLIFQDQKETLEDEDVTNARNKILKNLEERLNAKLRT